MERSDCTVWKFAALRDLHTETPLALKLLDVSLARTIVSSESFAAAELVY